MRSSLATPLLKRTDECRASFWPTSREGQRAHDVHSAPSSSRAWSSAIDSKSLGRPAAHADEYELELTSHQQREKLVKLDAHRFLERRAVFPASRKVAANELKLTSFSRRCAGVSLRFSRNNVRYTSRMYT